MKKLTKIILYCVGIFLILSLLTVDFLFYTVHILEGHTICSNKSCISYSSGITSDHYCSIEDKHEGVK